MRLYVSWNLHLEKLNANLYYESKAEWCVHGLQAFFPFLINLFGYKESGEQRIMLKMFILLFNLCSCLVGINQICNVFMPFLNWNANEEYVVLNIFSSYSLFTVTVVRMFGIFSWFL